MFPKRKLRLVTDFHDYYDHHFDLDGPAFVRRTHEGLSREEAWRLLSERLPVPEHGPVETFDSPVRPLHELVVVHLDVFAHQGNGKVLLSVAKAIWSHPGALAMRFVPSSDGRATTYRYLAIGYHRYWLKYVSDDSWRSNVGDVEIFLLGAPPDEVPELNLPFALYGVDFVLDGKGCLWAIDLNLAPGVRGTGIEEVLSPKEAVESIKARCHELGVTRM